VSNIYTQTNETENKIINFKQGKDGKLTEVQRVATGGRGTDGYSSVPYTGEPEPDSLTSSNAVIASKDKKYLFSVNAGDNTVSCFAIDGDGMLVLTDTQSTGNALSGKYGTASSLAYNDADRRLYVCHSFGPSHIKSFTVADGKLALTPERKSVNLPGLPDRVPTQITLTPNDKFLLACVLFDAPPSKSGLFPAKEKNLVSFPVDKGGALGEAVFKESGGVAPFSCCFLNGSADTFVTVLAAESSAVLSTISSDGVVKNSKPAKIDTTRDGKMTEPSEICWVAVSEDNKYAFGANFGYGSVCVFSIEKPRLSVRISEAAKEAGDGKFKGLAGALSSGAGDNAVLGGFLYQLYANAGKLVGYRIEDDGALTKTAEASVPRNSTQGLGKI